MDPDTPHTSETVTSYDPAGPTATEVRRTEVRPNTTAWWVTGIVLVALIVAIAFVVTRNRSPAPSDQAITAAADQGRAQGAADAAQSATALNQAAANASIQNAQTSIQADADRAAAARARAEAAAERAASNASAAAAGPPAAADPANRDATPQ